MAHRAIINTHPLETSSGKSEQIAASLRWVVMRPYDNQCQYALL